MAVRRRIGTVEAERVSTVLRNGGAWGTVPLVASAAPRCPPQTATPQTAKERVNWSPRWNSGLACNGIFQGRKDLGCCLGRVTFWDIE